MSLEQEVDGEVSVGQPVANFGVEISAVQPFSAQQSGIEDGDYNEPVEEAVDDEPAGGGDDADEAAAADDGDTAEPLAAPAALDDDEPAGDDAGDTAAEAADQEEPAAEEGEEGDAEDAPADDAQAWGSAESSPDLNEAEPEAAAQAEAEAEEPDEGNDTPDGAGGEDEQPTEADAVEDPAGEDAGEEAEEPVAADDGDEPAASATAADEPADEPVSRSASPKASPMGSFKEQEQAPEETPAAGALSQSPSARQAEKQDSRASTRSGSIKASPPPAVTPPPPPEEDPDEAAADPADSAAERQAEKQASSASRASASAPKPAPVTASPKALAAAASPGGSQRQLSPVKGGSARASPQVREHLPPRDISPGTMAHLPPACQKSQLGPQVSRSAVDSCKRSAPSYGFGSAPRFGSTDRLFISKEHSKCSSPTWTPAPNQYYPKTTLADKLGATLPQIKSPGALGGTEARFAAETREQGRTAACPGPGEYDVVSPSRMKILSNHQDMGAAGFGTGLRKQYPMKGFEREFYGTQSPGPVYKIDVPDATMRSSGTVLFPKATRDVDPAKAERAKKTGAGVPGPGAYDTSREDHTKKAPEGVKFPKAPREPLRDPHGKDSPGAVYDLDTPDKVNGKYRTAPGVAFGQSGRLPPVKPALGTPGPGAYAV